MYRAGCLSKQVRADSNDAPGYFIGIVGFASHIVFLTTRRPFTVQPEPACIPPVCLLLAIIKCADAIMVFRRAVYQAGVGIRRDIRPEFSECTPVIHPVSRPALHNEAVFIG